jgi:uncharacterized protein YdgA (DUF945 family)
VKLNLKIAVPLVVVTLVVAVGALAVPWYSSRQFEAEIAALAAQPAQGPLELRNVVHQAGLFSSEGSALVQMRSSCAQDATQAPLALALNYRISHLPTRSSLGQFTWTLAPNGASSGAPSGAPAMLTASGEVGFDGALQTDMALPAWGGNADAPGLRMAPSKARLRLDGKAMDLHWSTDDIAMQGQGNPLKLHGARIHIAMVDRDRGMGSAELELDTASTGAASLQGLRLRSEMHEAADRLNYQHSLSVRSLLLMNRALSDVVLEAAVTGLHAKSAQALATLYSANCGYADLSAAQLATARQALKTLVSTGFSVGIASLKARDADASVDAQLLLELLPSPSGEVALAQQLQSSGEIVVKGGMLTQEQVHMAMQGGYVQEVPGGLKMGYRYAAGALTVGDKSLDASLVPVVLARFDQAMNELLAPDGKAQRVVANEPASSP